VSTVIADNFRKFRFVFFFAAALVGIIGPNMMWAAGLFVMLSAALNAMMLFQIWTWRLPAVVTLSGSITGRHSQRSTRFAVLLYTALMATLNIASSLFLIALAGYSAFVKLTLSETPQFTHPSSMSFLEVFWAFICIALFALCLVLGTIAVSLQVHKSLKLWQETVLLGTSRAPVINSQKYW